MIIKWEDEEGESYFEGIIQVTKLINENLVKTTQVLVGGENKAVTRDWTHGVVSLVTDKGALIQQYDLGARKEPLEN